MFPVPSGEGRGATVGLKSPAKNVPFSKTQGLLFGDDAIFPGKSLLQEQTVLQYTPVIAMLTQYEKGTSC